MKKNFSIKWNSSKQTRKQRKYRYYAPMHVRQNLMHAHLDKFLRKDYNKRSLMIRKGDEVMIMRGGFKGVKGKISKVDMKALKIYVDSAKVKKVSGQDIEAPIDPSNVIITKLNFDDKKRRKFLERKNKGKPTEVKSEKTTVKPAVKPKVEKK